MLTPKNSEPFKTLPEIARKGNDLISAAEYLKRYTALEPSDDKMLVALGDLLYSAKELPGAYAAYRRALKANPQAKGFYERYVSLVGTQGTPRTLSPR